MQDQKLKIHTKDSLIVSEDRCLMFLNISFSLFIAILLSRGFGALNNYLESFYILVSVLTLFLVNLYGRWEYICIKDVYKSTNKLFAIALLLISLTLSFCYHFDNLYPLLSLPLMFLGWDLLAKPRRETPIILIFTSLYTIFLIYLNTDSLLMWHVINNFSYTASSWVTSLVGNHSIVGYSMSGFLILIPALLVSLTICIHSKGKRSVYIYPLLIVVAWIVYILVFSFASFDDYSDIVIYSPALFLSLLPILFFQIYRYGFTSNNNRGGKQVKLKDVPTFLMILSAVSLLLIMPCSTGITSGKKILFYGEDMLGSWDVPEYGKYGEVWWGMFGLLPYYLETYGYNCSIFVRNLTAFLERNQPTEENITRFVNLTEYVEFVESEKITIDILRDFDVLVVINLNKTFSEEEKKSIRSFVKNGGSLLVLGDHTNVGNIMLSLNDLLQDVGITFRFDSALPLDPASKWMTCYSKMRNPLTFGIPEDEIQISVGASLNISLPAFPIIVGDFAFSDYGDIKNVENAFLGNYRYDKGEILGNVVLVAGCYYGKGRVLVFGDTSPFQNPSLPYSHRFVSRVFNWLVHGERVEINLAKQLVATILILIGLLLAFKSSGIRIIPFALLLGILFASLLNSSFISDANPEGSLVYIDITHAEKFSIDPFNDNSVTGTMVNFARNGYLPIILKDFDYEKIRRGNIILIIAPNKVLGKDDVEKLMEFIKEGGLLILSSGYQCRDCVKPLLDEFNLDIDAVPLGPVPYVEENPEEYQMEPKFVDAWPILVMNKEAISYYDVYIENETYTLVTFIRYGKGGFVLISDNEFLLNKNIESKEFLWPGNVQFIKSIIDDVRERGVPI
ncbi:MAG: hypothetical protein DRN00_01460 [Thermoplasmata archaeon]|nr:MAG: hypothetical protein DRN00_01460 [Thermoplasmata archaeon]